MPETGERPYHKDVADVPACGNTVASQWDVDVIAEPASKRNMPAAPEFRDAGGNVRIIKVLVEIESQHLSKTDGHIGISAEIEIQLQCICANGKPGSHKRGGTGSLKGGVQSGKIVCKENLLGKPLDKELCTCTQARCVYTATADGFRNVSVADNGSGCHVRKHGAVYGIWKKSFTGFCFSHIDVQDVGQILKGIERKSDGQCKLRIGKLQSCDTADGIKKKSPVFEKSQDQKVDHYCENKVSLAGRIFIGYFSKLFAHVIIEKAGKQHKNQIGRISPCIKEKASCEKYRITVAGTK